MADPNYVSTAAGCEENLIKDGPIENVVLRVCIEGFAAGHDLVTEQRKLPAARTL
jgi:hypothetical protein